MNGKFRVGYEFYTTKTEIKNSAENRKILNRESSL